MSQAHTHQRSHSRQVVAPPLPCVWMTAGVVGYKLCDREFDCDRCPFDLAMHDGNGQHASASNPNRFSTLFDARPFEPTKTFSPAAIDERAFELDAGLFYHAAHVWARVEEGGSVRVGLDDFGQRLLGRIYRIVLPERGRTLKQNEACWRLTHRFGETGFPTPVAGTVVDINARLAQQPSLVNHNPYGEGWAFVVRPAQLEECLKPLRYDGAAAEWFESEIEKFYRDEIEILTDARAHQRLAEPRRGALAKELTSELTAEQARRLIDSFLPAASEEGRMQSDDKEVGAEGR